MPEYIDPITCPRCGASVIDRALHDRWHSGQLSAIREASRTPCRRCKGSGRQPGLFNQCGRCGGTGKENR